MSRVFLDIKYDGGPHLNSATSPPAVVLGRRRNRRWLIKSLDYGPRVWHELSMAENKPKRFMASRGWIQNDPASGTPLPEAPEPDAEAKEPNFGLGVGVAVGGWALAILPIMAMGAYIRLVDDCLSSGDSSCAGATEGGNIPIAVLVIACMVLGPAFLGVAAATKKGWAKLVTALLALPVIFVGYDLITNAFL